ncbi:GNAT family N-acetyltransferase [Erythrobacter sp. YT30]|uniref:GNAT family N-acetyltransferase n=1 Tax=Erythrobacter sp. YT30 TaxID=1735012 RepID=UPI00076BD737|nr:GNAT family N-acetyltransferase [Erythrobacter sp. YT30]KWV92882.1 hypothetical protein AUC45_01675 [Erythrobacter sp. YT30]
MPYSIRSFRRSDAPALAQLTAAAINTVGSARYSPEQVSAWAARHTGPERFLDRNDQGHLIWVAVSDADIAVAYSLLEPPEEASAHLDMLYCHPDHTRKGLAPRLLFAAEEYAREQSAERIYTEASELARPAFEKAGYRVTERRDFTILHEGKDVPIHNFAMEKLLD